MYAFCLAVYFVVSFTVGSVPFMTLEVISSFLEIGWDGGEVVPEIDLE